MQAVKVTEKVWWVGAIDWSLKEFHGYTTHRGTTYNAFLVMDEKIALIDTVKAPYFQEMMQRIASVVDPSKIDVIVSNHAEMDHSGSLVQAIEAIQPETVYASALGKTALDAHFGIGSKITAVKSGESVRLGANSLSFVETRMLHWPDSMFTYLSGEKVLFSQDGFGMHLATAKLFAEENDPAVLLEEATRYYANILLPYSPQALKLLEAFPSLGLDVAVIAPDHGPLWRADLLTWPLEQYKKFAEQPFQPNALVIYDTMWHSTEVMANAIADGVRSTGAGVRVMNLDGHPRSDVVTELMSASALVVGSPTINNDMFPRTADALTYLRGLRPKNKIGAAFGSFGWSGEAVAKINGYLKDMGAELVSDGLRIKYVPKAADLQKCFELGQSIGTILLERAGK